MKESSSSRTLGSLVLILSLNDFFDGSNKFYSIISLEAKTSVHKQWNGLLIFL